MQVDIGIACNKNQDHQWWGKLLPELMRLAYRGIKIEGFYAVGSALTDHNRNAITDKFLAGTSDAIWWIDDDTLPPPGALEKLIDLDTPISAGVYFLRKPPCNPVVYHRLDNGLYRPLWDYTPGEIITADSVGMGCTLIRRVVYEEIRRQYILFRRRNYTVRPVHRDDLREVRALDRQIIKHFGHVLSTTKGIVELQPLTVAEDVDVWPFYAFEHNRTEDHWFCEMARRCGFRIVVDTGIECMHWGSTPVTRQNFEQMKQFYEQHRKEHDNEGA